MEYTKFDINDFKLHNNANKLLKIKMLDTFDNKYEMQNTGFTIEKKENNYNTYIICEVLETVSDSVLKVGDKIVLQMVYILSLRDIMEGYPNVDEDILIVPERFVDGVLNE